MNYLQPTQTTFLKCKCVDKRISKLWLLGNNYYVTLQIDAAKTGQKIQEYQLDAEDYYKLKIGETVSLKFSKIGNGWYLNGSYQ